MYKVMYGFGGAENQYQCLKYFTFFEEPRVRDIKNEVSMMRMSNPSIKEIYILDNRHGLRREFAESVKKHSIESCAIFRDTCQREGIRLF